MFSRACEYAIRAALFVSKEGVSGTRLSIGQIARAIDSPVPFTAKILQTLVREGIISSSKGPRGGFYLDPAAKAIPLSAIVEAIDDGTVLHTCALGLKECSDRFPCPIHDEVKAYKNKVRQVMKSKTIQQLGRDLEMGKTHLKIAGKKSR